MNDSNERINEQLNIEDEKENKDNKYNKYNNSNQDSLQDELPNLDEGNIDELKMYLSISEEKNRGLARIVKSQSEEIKKLKEESDNQFEVIGRLASERDNLNLEIDKINEELSNYKDENLEDKLKSFIRKADSLNIEKIKLEEEVNSYKNDIKRLEELNNNLSIQNDSINERILLLEKNLNDKTLEAESINREYNELKFKLESLEALSYEKDAKIMKYEGDEVKNLKDEVFEEQRLAKDRIIIRQMNELSSNNEIIKNKEALINELSLENEKLKAELEKEKRINNASNMNNINSLLLRIKKNSLDLKLNEIAPLDQELKNKIISDYQVEEFLSKINETIQNEDFEVGLKEDIKEDLNNNISDIAINFINDVLKNEASAFDYIVKINDLVYEHEKECNDYQEKIKEKEKAIKTIQDELDKIKIESYRESKNVVSKKDWDDLRRENKELRDSLSFQKNEAIVLRSKIDNDTLLRMDALLVSERENHIQNENELKNQITILREKTNNLVESLKKLNGDYFINLIENEINDIKEYTRKVKDGEIELNSQLVNIYYNNAYDKFYKQSLIYKDEITKRNGMLEKAVIILKNYINNINNNHLEGDDENEEFADSFNKLQIEVEEINNLIIDIQNTINDNVVEIELDDKRYLDERIASEYKEKIIRKYQEMIDKINDNAKEYNSKLALTSIDNAFKLYNNDINEMAKYYANAINEARLISEIDSNEFSKLLENAKIMMLCNEFYALARYKENKYYEKVNPRSIEESKFTEELNNSFKDDIENLKNIQEELNNKLNEIKEDYIKKNNNLDNEIDEVIKNINVINDRLSALNDESNIVYGDVTTSINSLKIDLDAKKKVLDFLSNNKRIELEKEYNKKLDEIDNIINSINNNEREVKELYLDRIKNEVVFVKENNKMEDDISRIYGIKLINEKLINLNDIEYSLIDAMDKKDDELTDIIKDFEIDNFNMKKKLDSFKNLLYLKNEYSKAIDDLRINYKVVGDYANNLDEIKHLNKRLDYYENEKRKAKVLIDYGVDRMNVKDSVMMFEAKMIAINKRLDALNEKNEELKRISIVSEYNNIIDKLMKINLLLDKSITR
ncbi:MAG: hypothetical protein IJS58_08335 [Bacilli bacterium]|nr:hypothetical protein [Bacilli bacterium]